jgi:methionyl-tRNA synthetase
MSKNKFYITTAIPYVNARPHIGFAYELFQADVLARYHRQIGEDVWFLTGSDDNSLKNVRSAEEKKMNVRNFVDENAALYAQLNKMLNISNNDFIRTIEKRHIEGVGKLWKAVEKDIYKKEYEGLYCVGCEEFKKNEELKDGCCPEHPNAKLDVVKEENYFFKLSNYQEKLLEIIEKDVYKITPETRKNEALSFIKQGLEDFSISRSKERAGGWGIPVPGDDSQVVYVWFDALGNYLTALDYENEGAKFKKFWPADVHVIGKGILKFHAVYWPAMLLAAGASVPKELFVHGYITLKGTKIGKSLGNAIDPIELVEKFGVEPIKYFLLRYIPSYGDGDFTIELFKERYKSDLSDDLGNLLQRTLTMAGKYDVKPGDYKAKMIEGVADSLAIYRFDEALEQIWKVVRSCNVTIDQEKPWELAKSDPKKLAKVLGEILTKLSCVALSLESFMPNTSQKIKEQLVTLKPEPLFPRLEE